jgi:hypothetical protein
MYTIPVKLSKSDTLLFETYVRRTDKNGRFIERERTGPFKLSTTGLVHTCDGKPALWRFLSQQGLVEKGHKSPFGHPFNFTLTEKGREYLESICDEINQALFPRWNKRC